MGRDGGAVSNVTDEALKIVMRRQDKEDKVGV
jgi:hypothetical protein